MSLPLGTLNSANERIIACFDCGGQGRIARRKCGTCLGSGRLWHKVHDEKPPESGEPAVYVIDAACSNCGPLNSLEPRRPHKASLFHQPIKCGLCKTGDMRFATEPAVVP